MLPDVQMAPWPGEWLTLKPMTWKTRQGGGDVEYPPQFTVEELRAIRDSAQSGLLACAEPSHWLGLVMDLSRALEHEISVRLSNGTHG